MDTKQHPIERLSADDRLVVRDLVLDFISYARRQRKVKGKGKRAIALLKAVDA